MFEYYYSLGNERSLKKVCEKFKISPTTANRYSSAHDWQERIKELEDRAIAKVKENLIEDIAELKTRYRSIIQDTIDTFIDRLGRGAVVLSDIADLERLVKLDLLLLGEATEKIDNKYEFTVTEVIGRVKADGEVIEVDPQTVSMEPKPLPPPPLKDTKEIELDGEELEIDLSAIRSEPTKEKPLTVRKPARASDITR
jgi:hypothetical protein